MGGAQKIIPQPDATLFSMYIPGITWEQGRRQKKKKKKKKKKKDGRIPQQPANEIHLSQRSTGFAERLLVS